MSDIVDSTGPMICRDGRVKDEPDVYGNHRCSKHEDCKRTTCRHHKLHSPVNRCTACGMCTEYRIKVRCVIVE